MKTNDEIDEMIKDYIDDEYTMPDDGVVYSNDYMMSSNPSDYSDLISLDGDTIDVSDITMNVVDPYHIPVNQDITMKIDGKERSVSELFSTVDAIKDRLAILEPKQELLDKYELLQSLYEEYKAAEAMLYEPSAEDE